MTDDTADRQSAGAQALPLKSLTILVKNRNYFG